MPDNVRRMTDELEREITIYQTAYCDMLDILDIDGRCDPTDEDVELLIAQCRPDYQVLRFTALLAIDIQNWKGQI